MRRLAAALAAAALTTVTGCASSGGADGDGRTHVVAGLYPLAFVAEQVGGPHVRVETVVKPGVEPHDVELSPAQAARVEAADLVLVLRGFQPALDDAVKGGSRRKVLDAAAALRLEQHADEHEHEDEHSGEDPHFWLDPTLLATYAEAVAERLQHVDSAHRTEYAANATRLAADLRALDGDLQAGLRTCARKQLVTSHAAFGYLAERYGLTQVGIAGLSPDAEPSPQRIQEITRYVREHRVTTVFFETLVSDRVARTIAAETGAATAVLDPVEAVTQDGDDYFSVMRRNLATLRTALGCK